MMAVIFALVLLLWIVGHVQVKLLRRFVPSATAVQQDVYLVIALLASMLLLSAVLYVSLPESVLSAGWTQDQLERFWRWALGLQLLTVGAVFLSVRLASGGVRVDVPSVVLGSGSGKEMKKPRKSGHKKR
ncbi:MAG: hypothetical protein Q8J78_12765 [Moraxellaceae bacterium]|nr:hypothetical protein [Moraxellaceae bacterium]